MWMSDNTIQRVVVGRVGKAHGLAGDVTVELRTDEPELRFADGAAVFLVPASAATTSNLTKLSDKITVAGSRFHSGRFLVRFAGIDGRSEAESIRGMLIEAEIDPTELPAEEDSYYDRQLIGLLVQATDATKLGIVVRVDHLPGQDYLIVSMGDGEVMVPFVAAIVPKVDLEQRLITVAPPPGLFDSLPDEWERPGEGSGKHPGKRPDSRCNQSK